MDAKDGFLKKQIKYRPRIAQNLSEGVEVGCICKGCGQNARWDRNARWGAIAKGGAETQLFLTEVRSKRNGPCFCV